MVQTARMSHRLSIRIGLLIPLALASVSALGQRFAFESFSQPQGLKNIDVCCMLQDRAGLLWIGTGAGVYSYDGYHFVRVPIQAGESNPVVTALAQDGQGRIWYSTPDALGYFDSPGHTMEIPAPARGFGLEVANAIHPDPDDPNRVYFVSRDTLYASEAKPGQTPASAQVFTPSQIADRPGLASVTGFVALPNGRLWMGCGKQICFVGNGSSKAFGPGEGIPQEVWLSFLLDQRGTLWARGEHHLVRFDSRSGRFVDETHNLEQAGLGVRVPVLQQDPQGRVLVNLSSGMARYENGRWGLFRSGVDVPEHEIDTILTDRQGSVWLGINGYGIARWLGYDRIENWNEHNGLSDSTVVWNIARDQKEDLWMATQGVLKRMRSGSSVFESVRGSPEKPLARIQSLAIAADGHVWTRSDSGKVIDFDPVTGREHGIEQLRNVYQLFFGNRNQLWVCSASGLYLIDTHQPLVRSRLRPVLSERVYQGVHAPDGNDWFIGHSGLYRHSGSTWTKIHLPASYHTSFSAVITMAKDGTIWISGGPPALIHLKIVGDSAQELEHFDEPTLSSSPVILAAVDSRGWVWVGTDEGLDIYNGAQWRHLTMEDGLVWNDTDTGAFHEDTDGSIWIGTSGGASHVLHPEFIFSAQPLTLYLTDVRIGNLELAPDRVTTVPWGKHPLTADLSTLNFNLAHKVTFRYQIEGINEDWQDSPKHDLRYAPLSPGRYRLAVMAIDASDGLQSPVTYLAFVITPPWWNSGAVRAIEVLGVLTLLVGLWRWSVRRHIAREHQLEGLVRERTHELEKEKGELLRARTALQIQATHDPLTGLLNRGAIFQALSLAIERSCREGTPLGVVLADLDHFKQVNDEYGHLTGDLVLQEYAQRIKTAVRPYDEAGRYGGEEIMLVLPGLDVRDAEARLTELHRAVCLTPYEGNHVKLHLTCSFGFAWFIPGVDTVESLVDRADRAMYLAKKNGRNRIEFGFEIPMTQSAPRFRKVQPSTVPVQFPDSKRDLRGDESSHALHGLYSQLEKVTGPPRAWQSCEMDWKRRLRLGIASRSHFPALRPSSVSHLSYSLFAELSSTE